MSKTGFQGQDKPIMGCTECADGGESGQKTKRYQVWGICTRDTKHEECENELRKKFFWLKLRGHKTSWSSNFIRILGYFFSFLDLTTQSSPP